MKRTALKRKTPMKRGTSALRQRTPLPKVAKKKRRADVVRRFKAHRDWIASMSCCVCGSRDGVVAAHLRMGTDGGAGLKPSDFWVLPLCDATHRLQHQIGEPAFWAGRDPHAMCRTLASMSPVAAVRAWATSQ